MVEGVVGVGQRLHVAVYQSQARLGIDLADARHRRLAALGRCLHGRALVWRCGKQQLVIVTAGQGQRAPLLDRKICVKWASSPYVTAARCYQRCGGVSIDGGPHAEALEDVDAGDARDRRRDFR